MTIRYRDAAVADAEAVASIGARTFVQTFGHLYGADDLAAFLRENHAIGPVAALLAAPHTSCRLVEDVEGCAGYALVAPSALPHVPADACALEVKRLYLLPHVQGRGIADALMRWCEERARAGGFTLLTLSVFSDNHRAMAFYRRHGFAHRGDYRFVVGGQADLEHVWAKPVGA